MRTTVSRLCVVALLSMLPAAASLAAEAGRERFNDDWRFKLGDGPNIAEIPISTVRGWLADFHANRATRGAPASDVGPTTKPAAGGPPVFAEASPSLDHSQWRTLRLPHDWAIEGPFIQELNGETGKRPFVGVGWYRKTFSLTEADQGKSIFLDFDGAMSHACVWINGQFAGGWPYGYASFRVDATKLVKTGDNVVAVRLQNPPNSSRWYPGSGIYRNVWLVKSALIHVGQWGVQVQTPEITDRAAQVQIVTTIDNVSATTQSVAARVELFSADGAGNAAENALATGSISTEVEAKGSTRPRITLSLENPRRWSTEQPNRYVARVRLVQNGSVLDQYDQVFGVRTANFTADNGFVLNGQRLPLRGVCEHHDLGALGSAFNTRAMQRKLELLRSMGLNALRTSHNPPAPEVLELCDRLGIVVIDEAFDCWAWGKNDNDYGKLFNTWSERDLRALIRRDRNHPSVIAWSIGNEVLEQGRSRNATTQQRHSIGERLTGIAKSEDPTRPSTAAFNHPSSGFDGMNRTVDVMGFNYKPYLYERFHKQAATQPYVGAETSSTVSSRGEYFFPVTNDKREGKANFQMSSYDLYAPPWATTADDEFAAQERNPSAAGEFVWTGFDYIGEPTPYNRDATNLLNFSDPTEKAKAEAELKALGKLRVPSRSSYFGILDLAGFPKDRFYLYQAHWRPDLPMAHVLPHWNWPERVGQVTPVHVYTSGDEAELFLNGRSLGRKLKAKLTYRLRWDDVVYEPGELKVVTFKHGKPWAEQTTRTTGPATQLKLEADRTTIAADGEDLSFLTVSVADANGLMVPRSSPRITFTVEGPGEIVATDNGNPIDPESFQSPNRRAFNGLALAIVRAKKDARGPFTVTATADVLTSATVRVEAK